MTSGWCERCGAFLTGPWVLVSIVAQGPRRREQAETRIICPPCARAVTAYLQARPEVEEPPLRTITRGMGP